MKSFLRLASVFITASYALALYGAEHTDHAKEAPDPKHAPTAEQRAAYPMKTCVVTDDDLDEMGHPVSYVYKQPGKPDRVVLFCCKDCVADFEKDPAQYMKKLDEAEAKKAKK
jgi:hypothetical protein